MGSWVPQARVDAVKGKGGGKGGFQATPGCWICGSMNHLKRDCPQFSKGIPKGGGKGGQDQGQWGKGSPAVPCKGQAMLWDQGKRGEVMDYSSKRG